MDTKAIWNDTVLKNIIANQRSTGERMALFRNSVKAKGLANSVWLIDNNKSNSVHCAILVFEDAQLPDRKPISPNKKNSNQNGPTLFFVISSCDRERLEPDFAEYFLVSSPSAAALALTRLGQGEKLETLLEEQRRNEKSTNKKTQRAPELILVPTGARYRHYVASKSRKTKRITYGFLPPLTPEVVDPRVRAIIDAYKRDKAVIELPTNIGRNETRQRVDFFVDEEGSESSSDDSDDQVVSYSASDEEDNDGDSSLPTPEDNMDIDEEQFNESDEKKRKQERTKNLRKYIGDNDKCLVCVHRGKKILEVCHILPFCVTNSELTDDVIVLCCVCHRLFDNHLISIFTIKRKLFVCDTSECLEDKLNFHLSTEHIFKDCIREKNKLRTIKLPENTGTLNKLNPKKRRYLRIHAGITVNMAKSIKIKKDTLKQRAKETSIKERISSEASLVN